MRLTKTEKERLLDLLDCITDRCPNLRIDDFVNDEDTKIFWGIFKKLRLEVRGYLGLFEPLFFYWRVFLQHRQAKPVDANLGGNLARFSRTLEQGASKIKP